MPNDLIGGRDSSTFLRAAAGCGSLRLDRGCAVPIEDSRDVDVSNRIPPDLLAAFPAKRILVVGDVILDEYLWGDVRRISPEAPVPVVEIRSRTFVPGGAANAAANVVSLTGTALLGGVVGRDDQADKLEIGRASCRE